MHEVKYFKATCAHCAGHIEFPDNAVGLMINCPHCGQQTQLRSNTQPALPTAGAPVAVEIKSDSTVPPRKSFSLPLIAGLVCLLLALFAVGIFLLKRTPSHPTVNAGVDQAGEARSNATALTTSRP